MSRTVFSPLNTFRFIPNNEQIDGRNNTNRFDDVQFAKQRNTFWQDEFCYHQKVQALDGLSLILDGSFYTNGTAPNLSKFRLRRSDGTVMREDSFQRIVVGAQSTPPSYLVFQESGYFVGFQEGIYCIELSLLWFDENNDPQYDTYYSEPISLKSRHEGTCLIKYSNSYSKLFMPFELIDFRRYTNGLNFRVEGSILEYKPMVERTVFEDQNGNMIPLKSMATRQWDFYVGGGGTVIPAWVLDKLNQIFTCSDISIDNVGYKVTSGSTFEPASVLNKGKYGAQITLSQADQQDVYTYDTMEALSEIEVLDFSEFTYPYWIEFLLLESPDLPNNPLNTTFQTSTNSASRTLVLNRLNSSQFLPQWGGNFSIVGDKVIYNNTNNRRNITVTKNVLTKGYKVTGVDGSANNDAFGFSVGAARSFFRTDIVLTTEENPPIQQLMFQGSYDVVNPTVADRYFLVFFEEPVNIENITIRGKTLKDFVPFGGIHNNLKTLELDYVGEHYKFSPLVLKEGNFPSLETITVLDGELDQIFNTFNTSTILPLSSWQNLSSIYILSFNLSSAIIDAFFNDLYNSDLAYYAASGNTQHLFNPSIGMVIDMNGVFTFPATNASLIARNYLQTVLNITINL